jgi:hypothetical protein
MAEVKVRVGRFFISGCKGTGCIRILRRVLLFFILRFPTERISPQIYGDDTLIFAERVWHGILLKITPKA